MRRRWKHRGLGSFNGWFCHSVILCCRWSLKMIAKNHPFGELPLDLPLFPIAVTPQSQSVRLWRFERICLLWKMNQTYISIELEKNCILAWQFRWVWWEWRRKYSFLSHKSNWRLQPWRCLFKSFLVLSEKRRIWALSH